MINLRFSAAVLAKHYGSHVAIFQLVMVIETHPSFVLLVIQSVVTLPMSAIAGGTAADDRTSWGVGWFIVLVLEGLWIGAFVVYNGDPQLRALSLSAEQSWANATLAGNKMIMRNEIPDMVDGTLIGVKYGPVLGCGIMSLLIAYDPLLSWWQQAD